MPAKKESAPLVSPLYESGRMNGPVAGMKGGLRPPDPLKYLPASDPGQPSPSGNIADRKAQVTGRGSRDQSPDPGSD